MAEAAAQALLVVDVQRALVEGEHTVVDASGLVDRLRGLLERARTAGALVVHVQDDGDVLTRAGTPGWELVLPVSPGEPVLAKQRDDAFDGTDLGTLLGDARTVCVVGIQTEMCVAATARGAQARGLRVVLPRGGHSTYDVPGDGAAPPVSAAQVMRVVEWSLGDRVLLPPIAEVAFAPHR